MFKWLQLENRNKDNINNSNNNMENLNLKIEDIFKYCETLESNMLSKSAISTQKQLIKKIKRLISWEKRKMKK